MIIEDEIGRYKKKKESNVSKSKRKSKHKHEYEDCLLLEDGKPHKAKYCKICGKIDDVKFFETEKVDGFYRVLSRKEVFEKYKGLKQFIVNSIWDKYVVLCDEEDL